MGDDCTLSDFPLTLYHTLPTVNFLPCVCGEVIDGYVAVLAIEEVGEDLVGKVEVQGVRVVEVVVLCVVVIFLREALVKRVQGDVRAV